MTSAAPHTSLRAVWADLRRSGELWAQLTRRDIRLRYKQAVLGAAWALLMPALLIGAGLIVRMAVLGSSGGATSAQSLGGITVKGWAWALFAGAMNFATVSVLSNVQIVTKIFFPREVLPLSSVSAQLFDSLVGAVILTCVGPWLGFSLSPALLWIPLLVLLLVGFTLALAFFFSCANLFFRDMKYILQVLITFGVFFTPVFFDLITYKGAARLAMLANPLTPIMEGLRLVVIEGVSLHRTIPAPDGGAALWSPLYLVYVAALIAVILPASVSLFRRSSTQFAEFY